MKPKTKAAILLGMTITLLVLVVMPVKVHSVFIFSGISREIYGLPACYCPFLTLDCFCIFRDPVPN